MSSLYFEVMFCYWSAVGLCVIGWHHSGSLGLCEYLCVYRLRVDIKVFVGVWN